MGQICATSRKHPTEKESKKMTKLLHEMKKNGIDIPRQIHYAKEKAVQTQSYHEEDLSSVNTDAVFCFEKGRQQSQRSSNISLFDYIKGKSRTAATPEKGHLDRSKSFTFESVEGDTNEHDESINNDSKQPSIFHNRSENCMTSDILFKRSESHIGDNSSMTSYLARSSFKTSDYESSNSYAGVPVQIRNKSASVDYSINSVDTDANPLSANSIPNLNLEELCQTNEEFYNMDNPKRGDCIIFNVANIGGTVRAGTEKDVSRIQGSFRHLGFDVHVKHDPSKSEIKNVIRNYVDKDHSQEDCFACVILSHGKEGHVFAANEEAVCLDEIMDPVKKCSTLIGKPKLFFIQACRGTNTDHGVIVTDAAVDLTGSNIKKLSTHSDVLVSYATVQDFVAYRDVNEGTIYIRILTELLQKEGFLMKLTDLLNKVNNVTSKVFARSNICQVPSYTSTFRKSLQFTQRKKIIKKVSKIYYDDGTEEEAIEAVDGVYYI